MDHLRQGNRIRLHVPCLNHNTMIIHKKRIQHQLHQRSIQHTQDLRSTKFGIIMVKKRQPLPFLNHNTMIIHTKKNTASIK